MKVFLAGATGVLGRGLVAELRNRGHDVVGLSRTDANDLTLQRLGATPHRADLFDAASLANAAQACEVIVRAATHVSTKPRPTEPDGDLNDRIRREGTRALLDAARRVGARRYVQESIAWLARPDDGAPFTEKSAPRPDRITASALDAERMAAEAKGLDAVTLRFGFLYGPETAHTRQFAAMLRKRRLPVIRPGTAPLRSSTRRMRRGRWRTPSRATPRASTMLSTTAPRPLERTSTSWPPFLARHDPCACRNGSAGSALVPTSANSSQRP